VHEISIAQAIVTAACTEASRAGAVRIKKLLCRIGAMRHVDDWLLKEAFVIASAGSMCDGCEFEIEKTYMQSLCPRCQKRFSVQNWNWLCPTCGAEGQSPTGGDELDLLSIEAEVPDGDHRSAERVSEK